MAKFYTIKAKGKKSAEVMIYGDIGESWYEESVTAKQFIKEISALAVDDMTVRLNTRGGSVGDGVAIFNALKRHQATIKTVVDGIALSIGSLIAMAGDTVEMASNAMMMIHGPMAGAFGFASDMRAAADMLDKFAEAMATSYAEKTGKSVDEVMAWLGDGEDHWFSAEDAQAEGLIDSIGAALPVTAQFDLSRFSTMPAAAGIFHHQSSNKELTMPSQNSAASEQQSASTSQSVIHTPIAVTEQPNSEALKAQAKITVQAEETQRRKDIRARFEPLIKKYPDAKLDVLMTDCLDDMAVSVQAAVDKLMVKLGEGAEPTAGHYASRIETGESDTEKFVRAVTQSIMARCGMEKRDPANEFHNYSLQEVAQACLERNQFKTKGLDRQRMIRAALAMGRNNVLAAGQTTSDFPVLMENVMHRQVLTAYNATPDTWSTFCTVGSVSDFREWQRLRVGSIGDIDTVNEAGEYKHKVIPDASKEAISVVRRGNIIGITPDVIENDDIGYISSLTTTFGRAAKRTIETQVYVLLVSNPVLKDGKALFHADHKNLAGSGAIPSVDSLEAARVAMAMQKDIGGNEFLDIRPNIWLGGLARGGDVRVLVGAQYDPDTPNKLQKPNKVNGIVQNIIDTPRIAGTEWYLFADPAVAPVIEVVFLNGQSEPVLAMEENFQTAGVSYRVELPFGVGAIGYEGSYKNPGAAS
jgi:ATP-dependent Clp endopeptidase proteolytic subunit ClpP